MVSFSSHYNVPRRILSRPGSKGNSQKVRAMLKFILRRCLKRFRRCLFLLPSSFFMRDAPAPGSPFTGERALPPEVLANIEAKYHLNDPIMTQYFSYLKQLAHGDFGPSFKYKDYTVGSGCRQLPVSGCEPGAAAFCWRSLLVSALAYFSAKAKYARIWPVMEGDRRRYPQFCGSAATGDGLAITLQWLPGGGWNGGALKFYDPAGWSRFHWPILPASLVLRAAQ